MPKKITKNFSPCVKVCKYDQNFMDEMVCIGCFRERSEITNWQKMTLNEKKDALIDIDERRKKFIEYEQH